MSDLITVQLPNEQQIESVIYLTDIFYYNNCEIYKCKPSQKKK